MGMKSCLLMRLLRATEERRRRPEKVGRVTQRVQYYTFKFKSNRNSSPTSVRVLQNPNCLLVSFLTKTSHIEIHDHAPVNGISLFFTLVDNHWFNDVSFVRFKSSLKAPNHRKETTKAQVHHTSVMYTTPQQR